MDPLPGLPPVGGWINGVPETAAYQHLLHIPNWATAGSIRLRRQRIQHLVALGQRRWLRQQSSHHWTPQKAEFLPEPVVIVEACCD